MPRPLKSCLPHITAALQEKRRIGLTATQGLRFYASDRRHARASRPPAILPKANIPSQQATTPRAGLREAIAINSNRTASNDTPTSDASSANADRKKVNGMIWASSIFGLAAAFYISYTGAMYLRAAKANTLPQNADVSDRWRQLGRDFDGEVDTAEWWQAMGRKRQRLVNQAYGDVLEVSVGTGRNMHCYELRHGPDAARFGATQSTIRSLTFNDQSGIMLSQAEDKFEIAKERVAPHERFEGPVHFIVGDAGIEGVIKRPPHGFDTIIQTMGICSMTNPVEFLKKLGRLCRQPGETPAFKVPREQDDGLGGKILLLEHGRSHYEWLNRVLDLKAPMHADRYGCWDNKDIDEVLRQSGLLVERVRRYQLGTVWEIVLRPAPRQRS